MKRYLQDLAVVVAILLVGFGIGYAFHSPKTATQQVLGASSGPQHFNTEYFYNGLSSTIYNTMGSVNASSSSTTAATITLPLGSATNGQITLGTSTPGTTVVYASTTAISSANSEVEVQQQATTTIPGVTCNTTPVAIITNPIYASTTNANINGFSVSVASVPSTHPICMNYTISNKSN